MYISVRMPPFQGVAAGQTATVLLPIGRRYHNLLLSYAGVTLAQMTEIRVLVNGQILHRYSATERDTLNQFDGRAAAGGILVIPFNRYNLLTRAGEELTALNTGVGLAGNAVIATLSVEIDISGAAAAPALSLIADQSDNNTAQENAILWVKKEERTLADGLEISDLAGGVIGSNPKAQFLNKVYFNQANITGVTVIRDNFTIFERLDAANDLEQTDGVRVPQANWYVVDATERGYGGNIIQMIGSQDFRFRFTAGGAGAMPVISEFLGVLEA